MEGKLNFYQFYKGHSTNMGQTCANKPVIPNLKVIRIYIQCCCRYNTVKWSTNYLLISDLWAV